MIRDNIYKILIAFLLMILLGGINAWAQTDYSGTYYIYSNNKGNPGATIADRFYLCPSTDFYAASQPFVTTKKTSQGADSKWKIQYVKTENNKKYYHVIHAATDGNDVDKYLTYNDQIVTSGNYAEARVRVHLQNDLDTSEGHEDYNLFYITTGNVNGSVVICPKADTSKSERSLNPAKDNGDTYAGTSNGNSFTNYENNTKYCGGLIGLWEKTDNNSTWYLEECILRPSISSPNKNEIVVSHSEEGATIYYTIDDKNPTTTHHTGTGPAPLQIDMPTDAVTLKAIAVIDNLPSCISSIQVVPNATITLAEATLTYNGTAQTIGVTSVKDGDTPINASEYNVEYSDNINAGTATVNIKDEADGGYIVYGSTTFTINKKDLTVTAKPKTITYGEEPTNDGVTCEGFVNSETADVLGGTLDYAYSYEQYGNVGDYTITPSGLTATNYAISFDNGTLTVDKKEIGLTWSETTSFPYDGNSHCLTATATGMVNGDEIGVTVSGAQTNAGNHTATASELTGDKAGNYKLPTDKTQSFTITKAALSVIANNNTITYGDAPAGNGVTYEGFVNNETESVLGGTLEYDYSYTQYGDVGNTYTITPKGLTSGNYDISYVAGTLTVTPKTLTIIADDKSKFYGDDDPALTYTSEGLVGSDAITGALSREAGEDIGVYAIIQNTLTAGSNYTISYTGANLTINKRALTVTAKPKTITYGDAPANDGVTYSGFVGEDDESVLGGTLTYTYNYTQYGNVGNYAITPSGLTGDHYDISFIAGTLTVNQKEVGFSWDETTSFVYNASNQAPTATATGLLNGDEVSIAVTGAQTDVGEYTATIAGLTGDKAGNYVLSATDTKAYSITPAALTVIAKNHTIYYGDDPANDGVDYDGFAGDDNAAVLGGTLSYAYNYKQYGELGNYTITPSGLTSTNYSISYQTGTLTVKERTIVLKWTNTSFTYDREAHQPSATAVGTVNGEMIGITVTGAQTNAGTHTATASGLTGDQAAHYELPTVNTHIFTIAPKSLGDGDLPAEGITIQLTSEGELEYVKDGGITLTKDEDFTCDIRTEGSDQIVAVTGIGNYTGSLRGIYANPQFYDVDGEGAGKAVAVYMSSRDVNTFVGVNAYTVKSVNTFLGLLTISKLEYIPKGVPVLLLSESEATGFVVSEKDEEIDDISEWTVNSNLLKMAPTEGVPVETAQAYMFYQGEFVLTKAGTITEGKFYLYNPNYTDTPTDPGASPARGSLLIFEEDTTGMETHPHTEGNPADDIWYTLDGRRLSGKPANKGLYIHYGRKTVIK